MTHSFYEFFCGGGLARAGLGPRWRCRLANDIDPKKAAAYVENWGADGFHLGDVAALPPAAALDPGPEPVDLAWASFPCQDLSLAGAGAGLAGARSGAFWPFWRHVGGLIAADRAPRLIALENVVGLLSARGGRDMQALTALFADAGYRVGALVADAALFVPQSRPRLFLIAARGPIPPALSAPGPEGPFHTDGVRRAADALGGAAAAAWIWWRAPPPPARRARFADLIEEAPADVAWRSEAETARLIALMSPRHRAKLAAAQARARETGRREVGALYRRTRRDADGARVQRAEVRFDDLAGCLRTPAGGSSRQSILVADGARVRARLLSAREAAALMGLSPRYRLPPRYTDAYHLLGDGVAPPVVRHLARTLFEPLLEADAREPAPPPPAQSALNSALISS